MLFCKILVIHMYYYLNVLCMYARNLMKMKSKNTDSKYIVQLIEKIYLKKVIFY